MHVLHICIFGNYSTQILQMAYVSNVSSRSMVKGIQREVEFSQKNMSDGKSMFCVACEKNVSAGHKSQLDRYNKSAAHSNTCRIESWISVPRSKSLKWQLYYEQFEYSSSCFTEPPHFFLSPVSLPRKHPSVATVPLPFRMGPIKETISEMKVVVNKGHLPYGVLLTAHHLRRCGISVSLEWSPNTTSVTVSDKVVLDSCVSVCRHLARHCAELYGAGDMLLMAAADSWLSLSRRLETSDEPGSLLRRLDTALLAASYLVGESVSVADYAVWGAIEGRSGLSHQVRSDGSLSNVLRWFSMIGSLPEAADMKASLPAPVRPVGPGRKEEGKFVALPGAEMGKVVVRFPPEASGYLHIGHAKAALLNQHYQRAFDGKLIMRFDDTNPQKESAEFEREILHDLQLLEVKPDIFTHSSDHFDTMIDMCEKLLRQGKAFVDDTDADTMKTEREQMIESRNRANSLDKNLSMWREMLAGSSSGTKCCVRAKIDMKSPNGCLRDPTMYRCKPHCHVRTGLKYKVYPTYDFCCPIVDSVEGVTHALRTTEYHDRDDQYYWFIEALGLRPPVVYEYSRLNMTNTVLSKRKLTWFVEQRLVDGWDDPRFPTVRGILRRGMTVEGLRQFIVAQGSSRAVVFMEWDKIWAFNKKVIDPVAPRYTAIVKEEHAIVRVSGITDDCSISAAKHPKNADVGCKTVWTGSRLVIDAADVELLGEGSNATFINWGNLRVDRIARAEDGTATIEVTPQLDNKDFKKTPKLTWLCDTDKAPLIPVVCVYFDHIISKAVLAKDEDFKQFISSDTRREVVMLGDPELVNVRKSEIIQIQRRGFFICDAPYRQGSINSFCDSPCVLFHIPDGHSKNPFPVLSVKRSSLPIQQQDESKPQKTDVSSCSIDLVSLYDKVSAQGDKIRQMKSQKSSKADVDREVKVLLSLKTDYKKSSGVDFKPGCPPTVHLESTEAASALLSQQITDQGRKVRCLKEAKSDKSIVDVEVKSLLALKIQFKKLTGCDWKARPTGEANSATSVDKTQSLSVAEINQQIVEQGDKVRQLKTSKSDKTAIDEQVRRLLALKASYKSLTGSEWKSGAHPPSQSPTADVSNSASAYQLDLAVKAQGCKIRKMKADKADKSALQPEIDRLLALKCEFKKVFGSEWKPDIKLADSSATDKTTDTVSASSAVHADDKQAGDVLAKVEAQASKVRQLKAEKADKIEVDAQVQLLLKLKQQYKTITGQDVPASGGGKQGKPPAGKSSKPTDQQSEKKVKNAKKATKPVSVDCGGAGSGGTASGSQEGGQLKKQTRLGLEARKEDNLADWYSQVITKAELIEYYDVSGCYILRPWSFAIWDIIKDFLDKRIKPLGVQNCYFPIFVSKAALEKEKTHVADFSPEVAWVTRSGESELAEPIAIRPTSETVMYPSFSRWIQSHRDLPLKLNQWNNVVRWEFKHPQPFLRTREFLWQEGHTAFASRQEADDEVMLILDLYRQVYEDLLAVPVIPGRKTEKEKFAGGDYTTTVEAFISASGRAIQGATSHHLGQNFSRMFDIGYEHPDTQQRCLVFQNSWGITTRTVGVVVMVHGDNKGLVLPPRIASLQVVIVPCGVTSSLPADQRDRLLETCSQLEKRLNDVNIRSQADLRDNYSPGWKFNHWELKGVPVRLELGPRDLQQSQLVAVRRDTGEKNSYQLSQLETSCEQLLCHIQTDMLQRARQQLVQHTVTCHDFDQFCQHLDNKCLIMAPFCGRVHCEDNIKKDSAREQESEAGAPSMGAKGLCVPFQQPHEPAISTCKCVHPACTSPPLNYTLFGRSY